MNSHGGKRPGAGRPKGSNVSDHSERFNAARADKERSLADLRRMEVDTNAGKLIPAAEVEEAIATAFARIAQKLHGMPDDLERRGLLTPEQAEQAERIIHDTMDGISDQLEKLGPEKR
ncbi:DUF1441 family protein [Thioalkalivibrio sp. ALMg9]|uniref:DUF1441 family protein n=1 Tax=Thioalkalivibrio sp. ALMg9 TaxID=1266912 RepID=UPI001E289638|nr:DUF1441 family protein [Thioalkalivibrio sp. ALMg9]